MRLGLLLTYALALFAALGGLSGQPEHEVHLFLASHAAERYFDLFDPRWYGGFSVAGHPPLAHQLVALTAKLPHLGLERAYAGWTVAAAVLWVAGFTSLVSSFAGRPAGARAEVLAALNPLLYLFLFPFGQLPFVLSAGLAFFACAWARSPHRALALSSGLWAAAAICAHPVALLLLGLSMLDRVVALLGKDSKQQAVLGLSSLAAGAILAGVALSPFWALLFSGGLRQVSLAKMKHGIGFGLEWLSLALAIGAAVAAYRAKAARGWAAGAAVLLALGFLGGIPGIAADKLICLASLSSMAAWAVAWESPRERLALPVLGVLLLTCAAYLSNPWKETSRLRRSALREASTVLGAEGNERFSYLTIGVGNERLELGRRVRAVCLDGGMGWLRQQSLAGTPYPSLDELPLNEAPARAVFETVLSQAASTGLRWVLSSDDRANPLLEAHGYRVRGAWKGPLVLWEKDDVPARSEVAAGTQRSMLWGLMPPFFFFAALLALALALKRSSVGARLDGHVHA